MKSACFIALAGLAVAAHAQVQTPSSSFYFYGLLGNGEVFWSDVATGATLPIADFGSNVVSGIIRLDEHRIAIMDNDLVRSPNYYGRPMLRTYNLQTGAYDTLGYYTPPQNWISTGAGLTLSQTGSSVYSLFNAFDATSPSNTGGTYLAEIDVASGNLLSQTLVNVPFAQSVTLATRSDGMLISVHNAGPISKLVTIDPTTGATATVAELAFSNWSISGLSLLNGETYLVADDTLFELDPFTGELDAIRAYDFANDIFGIAVNPTPGAAAPLAIAGLLAARRRRSPAPRA